MKAIVFETFGGADQLQLKEVPTPSPARGEVLIRVRSAGVNPVDWKIREGLLVNRLPHEFPIIPGWDVAGEVSALGEGVTAFSVGDEVFAYVRKPLIKWGAYAEYVTFESQHVALKPRSVSFSQAAAIPLVSLTAWQSLFDAGSLSRGETVLIHASSGGVGSMAVQFAKSRGARILATARPEKHSFVKKLGADLVFDYRSDYLKTLEPVDLIFDCYGHGTLQASLSCLKKGGRAVSILEQLPLEEVQSREISFHYVFVQPDGGELKQIADLIDLSLVLPPLIEEMPLAEAALAQEAVREGKGLGKIVLVVS